MDYGPSDEHIMLRESVSRFVRDEYGFEQRQAIIASAAGWSKPVWQRFADLGLLALPFTERDGGLGQGAVESMIVMHAFGEALIVEPYLPTVVLAGGLLRHAGNDEQRARFIPGIVNGKSRYAFAFAEPQGRYNLADLKLAALPHDGGFRLSGHKCVVYGAPMADGVFVSARTAGTQRDSHGVSVFYVAAGSAGMQMRSYPTVDGMRAADISFEDVLVGEENLVGTLHEGLPLVERVIDEAIAALCAEAAGAMRALSARALDYAGTRVAFGKPLAEFQVLQHRLVDLRVACEYADAMAYMAAQQLTAPARQRARSISAAKVQIGRDSRFVAQNALQLHGAIGVTDELDVAHFFKRLTMIETLCGSTDHHLRRYGQLLRPAPAAREGAA